MSAELEFIIAYEKVKNFFSRRNENLNKINRDMKRNIDSMKRDLDSLRNISSAVEDSKEKTKIKLKEYIKYFEEIGEDKLIGKYNEFLEDLNSSTTFSEIREISSQAFDIYEDFKEEYEEKLKNMEEEKLYKEYLTIKLKEMGQETYIDENGNIIAISNDSDIVVNIEKDKVLLNIIGKDSGLAKPCISSIRKLEKSTKEEMSRNSLSWHTTEKEKEIKKIINGKNKKKLRSRKQDTKNNINQYYNKELLEREKV